MSLNKEKAPSGVGAPSGAINKYIQNNNNTLPPKKASVDLKCAYCGEYQTEKCKGLLIYHHNDCPRWASWKGWKSGKEKI